MRILAVDDDTSIQEILAALLRRFGHQVTPVHSGARALEVLKVETPDVVLTDIQMPGMSGWELLRRVRLADATGWIPFLFLTVNPKFPDDLRSLRTGADGFLSKPFYSEELLARLDRTTQRRQDRESLLQSDLSGTQRRLADLSVLDLLRILEEKKASTSLAITSETATGRFYLREGQIQTVRVGDSWGLPGFLRLLECDEGTFSIEPCSAPIANGACRLVSANQLLTELLGNERSG